MAANTFKDATSTEKLPGSWNQPCSDRHLAVISKNVDHWRVIAPFLGLTGADESAILESDHHSVPLQRIAMLRKWKQKEGAKATYRRLCRAFDDCERADLVDKVKQLLIAENSNSSDEEGIIYVLMSQC